MGIASTLLYPCSRQILKLKIKTIHVNIINKEESYAGGEELGEKEEKMGEEVVKYRSEERRVGKECRL